MFGECHAHLLMDGISYKGALKRHRDKPDTAWIRKTLEAYRTQGITFIRDGGDHLGVSSLAAKLAPEYGIDYRTPAFAIHHRGHYGAIVGHGYDTLKEYRTLVQLVRAQHGDFIKIMTAGIMDFDHAGQLTTSGLPFEEVAELVHIAHSEGFAVMTHVNGTDNIQIALDAGVDSIEHGNFMDDACLESLRSTRAIWVPTIAILGNLIGSKRYDDTVLKTLYTRQERNLQKAFALGIHLGLGSDAGAFCVPHVKGLFDEYHYFKTALPDTPACDARLAQTEARIRRLFKAGGYN